MKYLLLFLIFLFAFAGIANRLFLQRIPSPDEVSDTECSRFYEFNDSIIDLYSLETVHYKRSDLQLFKECSMYKNRFTEDRYGFSLKKEEKLKAQYCQWEFTNPSTVKVTDPDYAVNYYDLPHEVFENGKEQQPYTIAHPSGLILIYEFPDSLHYHLYKMKYNGEITGHLRIRYIHKTEIKKKEFSYSRFLYPFGHRNDHLVFSGQTYTGGIQKTVLVNLDQMTMTEFDFAISAVIWSDYDESSRGFILVPGDQEYKEDARLKMYWMADSSYTELEIPYANENCQTLLWNQQLVVANYSRIATGSSLHAFDLRTKKKLWQADVLQLNVDHSKYYNQVLLSKYRDRLVLEGNEAYGNYLQVFDFTSGKRLASFGSVK